MIKLEKSSIHETVTVLMGFLREQGKSPKTLKTYETSFSSFVRHVSENGITDIDEAVCLDYINLKTGCHIDRFECVTSNSRIDYRMRPLLLLLRYLEDGGFHNDVRRIKPRFICPEQFKQEYDAFCDELVYAGLSNATIATNTQKVQSLLVFFDSKQVESSADITIRNVEDFLMTHADKAVKYVGVFLCSFRKYFAFLYDRGYVPYDIAPMLPKVRVPRNASIPYVWSKQDIQKLLEAIDRADPKGKRDYAIMLLAVRTGLRIGDIRSLKLSSINWTRQTISLKMSKTGQLIESPMLKDVGWAIIDYLRNGRPATDSECVFVRHKAPFNAFGDRNAFNKELHRYIVKAGINIPGGKLHGMHSLRSTLAGNMLGSMSPIPVISETLGHQSVNTTSIYLKIDLEGLRKCALDPEEVFDCDTI
jgi:site-specific recombinase XerD